VPRTRAGGLRAVATNERRYGEDFYRAIGSKRRSHFSRRRIRKQHELAVEAGRKGGMTSRRWKRSDYEAAA